MDAAEAALQELEDIIIAPLDEEHKAKKARQHHESQQLCCHVGSRCVFLMCVRAPPSMALRIEAYTLHGSLSRHSPK